MRATDGCCDGGKVVMNTISINNAEHYQWGDACEGWHLLAGDDLSVIE